MKKVVNVTLAGTVFAVEEDAHTLLDGYLLRIKETYQSYDDYEEISNDIETAIAEKFTASGKSQHQAVTIGDVTSAIKDMGDVQDFEAEQAGNESAGKSSETESSSPSAKRLYRDVDAAMLGGVASGIAHYFDIDPVIVRIAFVLSVFFSGIGILIYLILWLVMPAAETTAERYAMRGDAVTLTKITEQVKKKVTEVGTEGVPAATETMRQKARTLTNALSTQRKNAPILMRLVGAVLGVVILFSSTVSLAALAAVSSVLWFEGSHLVDKELGDSILLTVSEPSGYVFVVALFVSALIPLLVLFLLGMSLALSRNLFSRTKVIALALFWAVALALTAILGLWHGADLLSPDIEIGAGDSRVQFDLNHGVRLEATQGDERAFINIKP